MRAVSRLTITGAMLFILALLLTLGGCGSDSGYGGSGGSGGSGGATTVAGGGTVEVHMKNTAFNPNDLTVDKGTTVKWVNDDSTTHTVDANDGSFASGNLSKGQNFEFTFNEAGTFDYRCTIHPTMKGKITVR